MLVGWLVSPACPVTDVIKCKTKSGSYKMTTLIRGPWGIHHKSGFRGPHSKANSKSLARLRLWPGQRRSPREHRALILTIPAIGKTEKKIKKQIHAGVCGKVVKLTTAWFIQFISYYTACKKKEKRSQDLHPFPDFEFVVGTALICQILKIRRSVVGR